MANIAITSDTWTEMPVTSGAIQNISATATIEVSSEQTDNSGICLAPGEMYGWDSKTIYVRAVTEDVAAAVRCVDFKRSAGGGGSYVLPIASANELGGIKLGSGLTIDANGVLSAIGSDPVGRVVFDYVLRDGYIRANGAEHASASVNYPNLVAWLNDNQSFLAADQAAYDANKMLYLYNSDTDALTVPDFTGLAPQGATSIGEIKAGLPNIKGSFVLRGLTNTILVDYSQSAFSTSAQGDNSCINQASGSGSTYTRTVNFNAHDSNSIYDDNNTTVQPPAAGLIPQIKY